MAAVAKLRWRPSWDSGLPRAARRGCDYEAYLPDPLVGRPVLLTAETAADVADAERAIDRLNVAVTGLASSEALARLLLRAEAVASSRIEGLEIGARRLLEAQLVQRSGRTPSDVTATEIINNIEAMRWAIESVGVEDDVTREHVLGIHERLLAGTFLGRHAGKVREEQNWIGGNSYNPCSAAFVPPPPEAVPELIDDLCAFCNDDSLPAVAQAALAHAQFETIHPFVDGNGRTGRALIHIVLRRRGLAPVVVPPISLVLATRSADYVDGLTASRYQGNPAGPEAIAGTNAWIATFAAATVRAVSDAELHEARVAEIQAAWRQRLGRVRADSAVDRLIRGLPGAPIVTVQSAAVLIGRSEQAVNEGIARLEEVGILRQRTVGRRNRGFEAPELIDAFTDLERQLASPDGDTRTSPPSRRVPYRRP